MNIKVVKGDLISLAKEGHFDIIAHGANCQNLMGAGIAYQISQEWPDVLLIDKEYRQGFKEPYNMMGTYSEHILNLQEGTENEAQWLRILNLYTQLWPGKKSPNSAQPFDYNAFNLVCKKVNYHFKGKTIGLPWIGCGLAGAEEKNVRRIIEKTLLNMHVTVVEYEPRQTAVGMARGGVPKGYAAGIDPYKEDGRGGNVTIFRTGGEFDERPLDFK